jgi:HlyD family secretion protein
MMEQARRRCGKRASASNAAGSISTRRSETETLRGAEGQGLVRCQRPAGAHLAAELAEVDLRTSREALSQAQAQYAQAQEQLAKTEIRSPLDGKVTAIYVKVGQTAVPSFLRHLGFDAVDVATRPASTRDQRR